MTNKARKDTLGIALTFMGLAFVGLALVACQPKDAPPDPNARFELQDNRVILDKSHILSTKTKLYQPSFELQGIVLPQHQTNLLAPRLSVVEQLFVQENQPVEAGTAVIRLSPISINKKTESITITAPFSGLIDGLYIKQGELVQTDAVLASMHDHHFFEFVSQAPAQFAKHLKVGQSVNFSIKSDKLATTRLEALTQAEQQSFSGQVAKIVPSPKKQDNQSKPSHKTGQNNENPRAITVHIDPQAHDTLLKKGMQVGGRITYGDLAQGAIVPEFAIADGASFQYLKSPPHTPSLPLPAKVWVIRQDGKLRLTDIHIVEYLPDLERYLVSGILSDSLITSANLPPSVDGYEVKIR